MTFTKFKNRLAEFIQNRKVKSNKKPISVVQIELTNHCNYRCLNCPQSKWRKQKFSDAPYNREKGYMPFDLFCETIEQVNEISNAINFSFFGEPMMHPEFLKFMNYLNSKYPQLSVVVNSNLSYATREIFQKLIEIELADLRISIDASSAETYEAVRPGDYFVDLEGEQKTEERFETICKKVEYWQSLSNHRPTRHVYTVNSTNINEINSYVEKWLPFLGDNDIILIKSVLTYGGKISDKLIRENPCNVWDLNMLTVDWTGKISPCNLDTNMDLVIGSIKEKRLIDLYFSKKRKQIELLSKKRELIPCKTCIDANNWSRNIVFKKGDKWDDKYFDVYR